VAKQAEAKQIAAAPVERPEADRVIELAKEIFVRRVTSVTSDAKTAAFQAERAFADAQTFWDEADTRSQ
jgi:hypothetical protein